MKTHWKIVIAVGIFLALMSVVWLLTARVQPENKVERYKKFLIAHGEKLDLNQLSPTIPDESNSLNAVETALGMIGSSDTKTPDAMKMVAPGKAMIGFLQPDARESGYLGFTNSWDEFGAAIAVDEPAIEMLHQVLARPALDFQLDYKKGFSLLFPHLAPMKRATFKLNAAAIYDLHVGDNDAALTNILTMLALVQRNEGKGLPISHLVRIAMAAITTTTTWEFLQATNATDAQLAALQNGWEQINFLHDAENTFSMERVWGMNNIEQLRNSPGELGKVLGSPSGVSSGGWGWEAWTEKPRYAIGAMMWCYSWSYDDELRELKSMQIVLEGLRAMQTNQTQFYKTNLDEMSARLSVMGVTRRPFFEALKIPDFSEDFVEYSYLGSAVKKTIRIETARHIVITAIALKRFQLKHGHWPQTLGELAPEFLAAAPIDPEDGKPLKYHPNADGTYLLYSVAEDGVDDGGDAGAPPRYHDTNLYWQGNHVRDWVWPQPATKAEIQAYYARPSK